MEEQDGKLYAYEFKWNVNKKARSNPSIIIFIKSARQKSFHIILVTCNLQRVAVVLHAAERIFKLGFIAEQLVEV